MKEYSTKRSIFPNQKVLLKLEAQLPRKIITLILIVLAIIRVQISQKLVLNEKQINIKYGNRII